MKPAGLHIFNYIRKKYPDHVNEKTTWIIHFIADGFGSTGAKENADTVGCLSASIDWRGPDFTRRKMDRLYIINNRLG
jgi:hypothetical protein